MRDFLIVILLCSMLPAAEAEDAAATSTVRKKHRLSEPLTVMTWNVEWFYDDQSGDNFSKLAKEKAAPSRVAWDWKRDAVAQSIAKANPSVLGLQEVENRRVMWYLTRAITRNHKLEFSELGIESRDHYTEQDVGFLFRPPVEASSFTQRVYPKSLRSTNQYFDLTKHLQAVFEVPCGDSTETVTVLNIHLRARPEAEDKRMRQARLLHRWISSAILQGQNVIVLGDFNSEFKGDRTDAQTDIGITCGLETETTEDDLIDLNLKLASPDRATHLLGGQYDRILCSRSLIEDEPERPDLVFSKIEVLRDLVIRNGKDTPQQHWDDYWNLPASDRDLSDHYPTMATFEVR